MVKSYYTAGMVYDILVTFGELSEEAIHNRKYAKYKAAYIHNCLKSGQTPIPGPHNEDGDEEKDDNEDVVVGAAGGPSGNGGGSSEQPTTPPEQPSDSSPQSPLINIDSTPTDISGS